MALAAWAANKMSVSSSLGMQFRVEVIAVRPYSVELAWPYKVDLALRAPLN